MSHYIKMQIHIHVAALTNFTMSAELNHSYDRCLAATTS